MHLHNACFSGNKNILKKLVESVPLYVLETKDESGNTPLMITIMSNSIECGMILLKAGVSVENSNSLGQSALHLAVTKGNYRFVKLLLSYNASYQQQDFSGITPLHLAAAVQLSKCLSAILKVLKPGESDIQDASKKTALHWCSAYALVSNIKILLSKEANICIPDNQGKTPLHWAASNPNIGALECVKILLEKESNIINWQDYEGRSALHLAVATGNVEVVRFLVSKGTCDIDILDNAFCTPLHWAAKKGLYEKADILLKKSIYTSADDNGATPLHYAAFYDNAKTIEIFLSRSYISDIGDTEGRNAIMWAAAKGSDSVINVMAENGSDLKSTDKNGLSGLHIAAMQGHLTTIKLLMQCNVPINSNDKYGFSPLLRACQFGRAKAAQLLIDLGADINAADNNSRSMLHLCAIGGHAYLCQILLHKGVSSNVQDCLGKTPLHYACMKSGYLNCVSVLLESNADTNIPDYEGKLPLHWAILANHSEIVSLLIDYDTDVNSLVLSSDWMTALDFALFQNNPKILNLLEMCGAMTAIEIKQLAIKRIKKLWKHTNFAEKILSSDPEAAINGQSTYQVSTRSVQTKNMIVIENKNNSDLEISKDVKQAAAFIIQKAWRKHAIKEKFLKMQITIKESFNTVQKRINAEKAWCLKLQSFIDQW